MKIKKRMSLTMVFLLVGMGTLLYSQNITVNNPAAGNTWCKSVRYTINWTKTGTMHARVKIRLYNTAGTVKILNIADDTANNGSYGWAVPGSVASGDYRIRVKTLDNEVFDDSEVFSITVCEEERASITVTSPASGVNWQRGTTKSILWAKVGTQDSRVKIRLYNPAGTTKVLNITDDTPNDGQFDWPIPATLDGGEYIVRVKTLDNTVEDDSSVFNITIFAVYIPRIEMLNDLELKSVYFTDAMGGKIVARIKSVVNPYRGNITVMYKTVPRGAEKSVTKRVNLRRGGEAVVALFDKTRAEMGCSGIALRVEVDPANAITESNEGNNVMWKTVYATSVHDGKIEYVKVRIGGRDVEVTDGGSIRIPGSSSSVRVEIKVRVRNCGGTRLEGKKIDIHQNYQSTLTEPRGHCRDINEVRASKTGISLSPGIARTYTIPVTLTISGGSKCRVDKNEIAVNFQCDENRARSRNNILKFTIR